jgi:hypothetical protein
MGRSHEDIRSAAYLEQVYRVHDGVFLFRSNVSKQIDGHVSDRSTYRNACERAGHHVGGQGEVRRERLIAIEVESVS